MGYATSIKQIKQIGGVGTLCMFFVLVGCQRVPRCEQGPTTFQDQARFDFKGDKKSTHSFPIPEYVSVKIDRKDRIDFTMVRVPGDASRGIKPFYLSTTEVSAGMFFPWATGEGIAGKDWADWASLDLRPSRIAEAARLYGPKDRPAMGMSRTAAELYCRWLSRQTGRSYRLPTETEWEYALELGGGVPANHDALLRQATLDDNAIVQDDPPFYPLPSSAGQRHPDAMGLYDMLGNAAEWVADTGDERVVRGGHFLLSADELNAGWRWVEDVSLWDTSFPFPIAQDYYEYWYRDFYVTGIRLACDADQALVVQDESSPMD